MKLSEVVRWLGSIGIFYVLIPAYLVASEPLIRWLIPIGPPTIDGPVPTAAFACAGLIGLGLVFGSIASQLRLGRGHPFDMTGTERLSRPTQVLLSSGVYALCRNPMGLGDVLLYSAVCFFTGATMSLLTQVPAYAVVVIWNHLINERPALIRRFGDAYLAYEKATPMLFPSIGSLRRAIASGHGQQALGTDSNNRSSS